MNPTDEVYLIKQYIDTSGNFYPKGKYLYGEMPRRIKDDITYVVPVNNVVVNNEPITGSMVITDELVINMTKDELKPLYSNETITVITPEPTVEEVVVQPTQLVVPRKRRKDASQST